jgi:hypothetical protein
MSAKLDGVWKITDYPQHSECVGCTFDIAPSEDGENTYNLESTVRNTYVFTLQHDPTANHWKTLKIKSTLKSCTTEEVDKEQIIKKLVLEIEKLEAQGRQLTLETNDGEKVRFNRLN